MRRCIQATLASAILDEQYIKIKGPVRAMKQTFT